MSVETISGQDSSGEWPASEADAKRGRESGQGCENTQDIPLQSSSGSGGEADAARSAARPPALPCQYRHNCPSEGNPDDEKEAADLLARARRVGGSHRKTAYALKENVGGIVRGAGVNNCAFLTPTFENLDGSPPSYERAQSCWRRLEKKLVLAYPGGGVRIMERGGKKGRLHPHVLLDVGCNVRTGYDFAASRAKQAADSSAKWMLHASANENLQRVSAVIYEFARESGFGVIFHCEPVRSEGEAIKLYLSKYICKHIGQRLIEDKGRRLVAYFGKGAERRDIPAANGFGFGGGLVETKDGKLRPVYRNVWAWLWRTKARTYWGKLGFSSQAQVTEELGRKQYRHMEEIRNVKLDYYPYIFMAIMDARVTTQICDEDGDFPRSFLESPLRLTPGLRFSTSGVRSLNPETTGFVVHQGERFESAEIMRKVSKGIPLTLEPVELTTHWANGHSERNRME